MVLICILKFPIFVSRKYQGLVQYPLAKIQVSVNPRQIWAMHT